jgi:glycerol-3-phosphate dehydrogenase
MRDFACHHLSHHETFGAGTTIMTDLGATCFSPYSHNLQFGQALATRAAKQARATVQGTVEGIQTTLALAQVCHDFGETMPISYAVWSIMTGKDTPIEARKKIMARPIKYEG